MKKILFLISIFITSLCFSQSFTNPSLKLGSTVNENVQLFDAVNTPTNIKIPNGNYMILYKHDWEDKTKDTEDSIKLVNTIIENIIKEYGIKKNLRVICYSTVMSEASFQKWMAYIKKDLFKAYPKYKVEYYCFGPDQLPEFLKLARIGGYKLKVLDFNGKILGRSQFLGNYGAGTSSIGSAKKLKGKLLTEESGKRLPIINAIVKLFTSNKSKLSAEAKTDKFGDFELALPTGNTDYNLTVEPESKDVKNVILATQNGVEISRFKKTNSGFEYPLLPADIVTLTELEVKDDISITFNKFKGSGAGDLKVTENIVYGSGKFNIEKQSEPTIDKVISILKENPKVKLEVISHTDSQGEDAANLSLSEKRSNAVIEYMVTKGIDKGRLKAIGKGETAVRNRCANGIECSDKEHEYNRRTEFNFTKG